MHHVRNLISKIRAALGDSAPVFPLESLAAEYARWREEAARRLEACGTLLARGSEHSALELAEAEPPLLDLVAELSFAEEPQWQSLCTRNELPLGPSIDAKIVAALDEVYAKGLSPNSPLYQEYRAAVTARDEAKALHIIRTIARVNPSDANAQAELDRLRNKAMLAKLEVMRAALASGDDTAVSSLVEELENLVPEEKLAGQADFPRALAIHKRVLLANAGRDLPVKLDELERLQKSGDWQKAAECLAALEEQERDLGMTLDGAQSGRKEAVRRFVHNSRVDVEQQRRFMQAVERLRLAGEQTATRAAGESTLTLTEAREIEAKLDQLEHEVKQFGRTVPADAAQSIEASRKTVHGAAARISNRIAMRRAAMGAIAVLAISAVLGWVGRTWLVHSYRDKLARFQSEKQALAAGDLLDHIQKQNLLWIQSSPELQAAVAETGHWVSGQAEIAHQAQTRLADLEKQDPAKASTVEMYSGLSAVRELAGTLAPDMALPLKERIAAVQRTLDAHFVKLREVGGETWQSAFSQAQKLLDPLENDTPHVRVVEALAKTGPLLRTLEAQVNHPVPALRPGADAIQQYEGLSKKDRDLRARTNAFAEARSAMEHAETLEGYAAALTSYTEVRFAETLLAQPILKDFPTADDVPTRLLMGGDLEAWKAVKMDKAFGVAMHPQDVRQDEVNLLLLVRDDPDLRDVWQWTLVGEGGTQTGYSRGQLREYSVGGETRYTGKLWQTRTNDLAPAFAEVKLSKAGGPTNVSSYKLSAASRLLEGLQLQTFTDATGTQWARSAFEVIHDIVHSVPGSATARAILMQHIGALISLRPYDWGAHYCPSLRRDLAELDTICGGRRLNTFEWMLPASTTKLEDNLAAYFDRIHPRDYINEARRLRDVALAVRDAGTVFAGFVDQDGTARITSAARSATELWCVDTGYPVLLHVDPGAPNSGLGTQTKSCRPFSVLVSIPLDRQALLRRFGVTDPVIPFLQTP